MRGGSSRRLRGATIMTVVIVGVLAMGGVAWGGFATIMTGLVNNTFDESSYIIEEGTVASFFNGDTTTHNVTANQKGPDGGALFRTGNIPRDQAADVAGTQFLDADSYAFVCTIHPQTMQATLNVVDGPGEPVPRPDISLKVKSKKLAKVVDSGRLQVKVKAAAPTRAANVELKAKKGKKGITKGKSVNVAGGRSKTVKLKLSKGGEKRLADLGSAKVKVQGTVDFGFGDKASKKLK